MRLETSLTLHAGGPGSGRHMGDGTMTLADARVEAMRRWGMSGYAKVDKDLPADHPDKYFVGKSIKVGDDEVPYHLGHGASFEEAFGRAKKLAAGIDAGGVGSGCRGPHCGRHPGPGKNIEEGDRVILKAPVKVWEEHGGKGQLRTYPAGREATVIKVDEKIGTNPQTAVVKPGKYSDPERMKLEDLFLLKKGELNRPQFSIKDVSKSKVITKTVTKDGAKYTQIKPTTVKEDDNGRLKTHGLKGEFTEVTGQMKVYTDPNTRSQIFFAQPRVALVSQDALQGTTVFVFRHYDTKMSVIREYNAGAYGHSFMMAREWQYKNMGSASGFLKARYGISQKLPRNL